MSNRVVHFEIPADDLERAKAFYSEVFDWTLGQWPGQDYVLATTGPSGEMGPSEPGYINGGMLVRQDPITSPVVVIDVPDIDAAVQAVTGKGGTLLREKMAVGEMGFAAYFADPEGNTVGLWQSAAPPE